MNHRLAMKSYSLGVALVVATVALSAAACIARMGLAPAGITRAGESLELPLGAFRFTERNGRTVTEAEFQNKVILVSFIFTRCPLSCPRITAVMKSIQDRASAHGVVLASITVDPDYDTPEILQAYAKRFGASSDGWWFLRTDKSRLLELVHERFKLSLSEAQPSEAAQGAEAIEHSDRIALVEGDRVVGYYDSTSPEAVERALARASRLAKPAWVKALPKVNASLNALCAVFLVAGWMLIRSYASRPRTAPNADPTTNQQVPRNPLGDLAVRAHVLCMVLALATSALFLSCYLLYHYQAGSMPYPHPGPSRIIYFTVLISHTILATLGVVPLVVLTLLRALRKEFHRHASIARITFPIWFYVSVTGVLIYWMLYQMPAPLGA